MPNDARTARILAEAQTAAPRLIEEAMCTAGKDGVSIGRALERAGVAGAELAVARTIATSLKTEVVRARDLKVGDDVPALPFEKCRRWHAFPLAVRGKILVVAMADPLDYPAVQDIEFVTGLRVEPVVATETDILAALDAREAALRRATRDFDRVVQLEPAGVVELVEETASPVLDLDQASRDASLPPVVRLVNAVLSDAARAGASDVHVEPQESHLLVRQRVDGMLHDTLTIPRHMQDAVISRLKVLASMDIAERRKPQDGRSRLRLEGRRVDLRLSTLPTQHGEKVVVRLLDSSAALRRLEEMSFSPENLQKLRTLLARPQGLILVTGPTGSGKTSTLHAALQEILSPTKNIITLEDPIEYRVAGLNQVQVNPKAGVTFATGLRSILRQDPNVVLVGEIRDTETGAIVLEAAQTGHLLLSTLHANDAPGAIVRLVDLGLEPFLVAASLSGVLAQRLVRTPCHRCAAPAAPSGEVLEALEGMATLPENGRWIHSSGCDACLGTGYSGRTAIHELLVLDDALRERIVSRTPEHSLRDAARAAGMRTLLEDGIETAARGMTTLEEVLRVCPLEAERHSHGDSPSPEADSGDGPLRTGGELIALQSPHEVTVLVVDDSPVELTVVKYFLEAEGYKVITACDGANGLAEARRHRPDVIVSDVDMPGMDGLTLVQSLREDPVTSAAAILLLTSDSRENTELSGLSVGADDFLNKPVNPNKLKARIRAVMTRLASRRAVSA